jgi:hypothetical protein
MASWSSEVCTIFPDLVPCFDVFPDSSGVLEGDQLVKSSNIQGKLWYCEQAVYHDSDSRSNHCFLRPISTTPPANPSLEGTFEDWAVLSRPASRSVNIHIYRLRGSLESTSSLVCFPESSHSGTARKPLHRTYLHRLRHPGDQGTTYYTRLSICSTMTYSLAYSTTIDGMTRIPGMTDSGGAISLIFVEDGVSFYTHRHSTWVCIFYARMAPL